MSNNSSLEEMVRYLKMEVPHYLGDNFRSLKPVGDFTYSIGEGAEVSTKVYEVLLNSGRKVFAVEDRCGESSSRNVYKEALPNPEIASKVHLYFLAAAQGASNESLDEVAGWLELPEQFRKVDADVVPLCDNHHQGLYSEN